MNHLKEKLPREITISCSKILCRNIFPLNSKENTSMFRRDALNILHFFFCYYKEQKVLARGLLNTSALSQKLKNNRSLVLLQKIT